jgi:UDP-perosamine 4-acetyltransferase
MRDRGGFAAHEAGGVIQRIVIVGAGDHARVLADIARSSGVAAIRFIEPDGRQADRERSAPRADGDLDHPDGWLGSVDAFAVGLGDNRRRAAAWERCLELGLHPVTLVHPSAVVLGGATIEEGAQVCAAAVIGVDAVVAGNAIINTAASIDHDAHIGSHAQVGPGCHLAGRVTVEEGAFVGTGASVTPGRRIGAWAMVGAGAAVIADVEAGSTVGGVPAHELGQASG